MRARKYILEFLTDNPNSDISAIVADAVAKGAQQHAVLRVVERMQRRGKIVKNGDTYSLAA